MKRKDFEEIFDWPFRKSRRLDGAELVQCLQQEGLGGAAVERFETSSPVLDDNSEEKAIVLYSPTGSSLISSPNVPQLPTIVFHSDLIPGLRDHLFWPGKPKVMELMEDEGGWRASNNCLAVVPWVASQLPLSSQANEQPIDLVEMDTEGDIEMMDMEECGNSCCNGDKPIEFEGMLEKPEGYQDWIKHWDAPQLSGKRSSPITW